MKHPVSQRRELDARSAPITANGLAGWFLSRLRRGATQQPRVTVLERVTLAPRQSLALVEADGRRLLIATSSDGGPVFHALDQGPRSANPARPVRRISW